MIKIVGKDDKNNFTNFRKVTSVLESFDSFPVSSIEDDKIKNYFDLDGVQVLATISYPRDWHIEEREIYVVSGNSKPEKTREVVELLRSFKI